VKGDTITIMPVTPNLLPRRERKRLDGFTSPSTAYVIDFTPNILGPLEGFSKSGCEIFGGMGFNESLDMTWRVSL
jgi:hypothetical protein